MIRVCKHKHLLISKEVRHGVATRIGGQSSLQEHNRSTSVYCSVHFSHGRAKVH